MNKITIIFAIIISLVTSSISITVLNVNAMYYDGRFADFTELGNGVTLNYDITGDGNEDNIKFTPNGKDDFDTVSSITLEASETGTNKSLSKGTYNLNGAYSPRILVRDFTGDSKNDILIIATDSMTTMGYTLQIILTYENGVLKSILDKTFTPVKYQFKKEKMRTKLFYGEYSYFSDKQLEDDVFINGSIAAERFSAKDVDNDGVYEMIEDINILYYASFGEDGSVRLYYLEGEVYGYYKYINSKWVFKGFKPYNNSGEEKSLINININNTPVNFTSDLGFPFVDENSRTQVPFRATMEAFGATVGYNNNQKMAYAQKGNTTVYIPINQNYIIVNDTTIENDTAAIVKDNRTYCPIRKVLEAFGATVTWDGESKTVMVSSKVNQQQKNIDTMLNTKLDDVSYWAYFSETGRWSAYQYLDDYYNAKGSWSFLQGAESFFRKNIAPSMIMVADKLNNDGAFTNQSKDRAKKILIELIKSNCNKWAGQTFVDEGFNTTEDILSLFEDAIKLDKPLYENLFDGDYTKLQNKIDELRKLMNNNVVAGHIPTPDMLSQLIGLSNDKKDLVKKLENNILKNKKLDTLSEKLGLTFDTANMARLSFEKYQLLSTLLEANNNFLEFLRIMEEQSKTSEVREAAKELRDYYKSAIKNEANILISSIGDGSWSQAGDVVRDWIIDKNFIAKLTNDIGSIILNTDEKVEKFETLRMTVAVSYTFDDELKRVIDEYKSAIDNTKKLECIDYIFRFSPYVFSLHEEGEKNLCKYTELVGATKNDVDKHLTSVDDVIKLLKDVLITTHKAVNITPISSI